MACQQTATDPFANSCHHNNITCRHDVSELLISAVVESMVGHHILFAIHIVGAALVFRVQQQLRPFLQLCLMSPEEKRYAVIPVTSWLSTHLNICCMQITCLQVFTIENYCSLVTVTVLYKLFVCLFTILNLIPYFIPSLLPSLYFLHYLFTSLLFYFLSYLLLAE